MTPTDRSAPDRPSRRIGLLRHFRVTEPLPSGWRTAGELQAWRERYDVAPIEVGPFDLGGVTWEACLASDLPRARQTAAAVFPGVVETTPLLREARFTAFRSGRLRLPVLAWRWLYQLAWQLGIPSQRDCRDEFQARVHRVAECLRAEERDLLVVSHAGMMMYLGAALRRRGFRGPKIRIARHARVYLFERR